MFVSDKIMQQSLKEKAKKPWNIVSTISHLGIAASCSDNYRSTLEILNVTVKREKQKQQNQHKIK